MFFLIPGCFSLFLAASPRLPTEGSIWKAQGLRLAYVAQHAFHRLEKHMQETPTAYIMWRFAGNDDRDLDLEMSCLCKNAKIFKWRR